MSFDAPQRLWLLIAIVVLAAIYVAFQFRRRPFALKFTNLDLLASVAPKRPGWRRHVHAGIYLVALAVLIVGFAKPTAQVKVPRERATIIMAIDTSLSMDATDIAPSRLEAAKAAANDFIDVLPPKINVGLVTFNGNASLKVPPTTDRAAIRSALDSLRLGERTAIGEAIFTSLDAIASVPPDSEDTAAPARIVLMSDGTTTYGRSNEEAVDAANEAGVPVSTIAFGTDYGTITVPQEPFPIPVPVDRDALEQIAKQTDGKFYTAVTAKQLKEVYENIGTSVGYTTEPREITEWFVAVAMITMLIGGGVSLIWFNRLP